MYCKYCGTNLPDTARFCSECGAMVEKDYTPPDTSDEIVSEAMATEDTYEERDGIADDTSDINGTRETTAGYSGSGKQATMGYSANSNGYNNGYSDYARRQAEAGGAQYYAPPVYDNPLLTQRSTGITVLCFILPLIGLILWLVWKNSKPGLAVSASKGALAGVCLGTPILGLVLWLVWRDNNKEMANPCGIAAIVGAILSLLLPIFIFFFALIFAVIFEDPYYGIALATLLF